MKVVKINPRKPDQTIIEDAVNILENDGVIVYPTDTIYGLGANIYSEKAIKKVYKLKKRDYSKPLSVCISKIEDMHKIAYLNNQEEMVKNILPGPFTIICRKKEDVSSILTAGKDKIGVRIPDNQICRELTRKFPITTTSANISGREVPESVYEVVEQLGENVDMIIDAGRIKGVPSTVIDFTTHPPQMLRKGLKDIKFE